MSEEVIGSDLIDDESIIPLMDVDSANSIKENAIKEDPIILELGTENKSEDLMHCYNYEASFERIPDDLAKTYTNLDDISSAYSLNGEEHLPTLSTVIYDLENYDNISEFTNSLPTVAEELSKQDVIKEHTPPNRNSSNASTSSLLTNLYQNSSLNMESNKMLVPYSKQSSDMLNMQSTYSFPLVTEFSGKLATSNAVSNNHYTERELTMNPLSVESSSFKKSEIVPPPIYMPYVNMPEHSIVKESNPSWKDRVIQSEKGAINIS